MKVGFLVLVTACGAAQTTGGKRVENPPQQGALAWADAIDQDRPHDAYDLLSSETRKELPFDAFERQWKENAAERKRQSASLRAAYHENVPQGEQATLFTGAQKSTSLVHDPNGWRVDDPLLSTTSAATPQDALRLFANAVEGHSLEGALRVLTSTRRDGIRDVLDSFVVGLKAHLNDSVDVQNDRATLNWNDGKFHWKVTLKKEEGEWRIDDIGH